MKFTIIPADNFIWNQDQLLDFLIANQNQDIELSTNAEGCCATAIGLYTLLDKFKFQSVKIKTANPLEQHPVYQIEIQHGGFLHVTEPVNSQYHTWNHNKIFGTIYARPLWHRIGIATHLKTVHPTVSTVGFIADPSNEDSRGLFEIDKLWKYDPGTAAKFSTQYSSLPWRHNNIGQYCPGRPLSDGYIVETLQLYTDFLIDVVAESFTSGNCFFVTEKTVRPIMLRKPSIIMGPANYLDYLHQMGFRTFNQFWDESYDGFTNADRYVKILKLIDSLAGLPISQLQEMYVQMTSILDHNYNLLLTKQYNKDIRLIE